LRRSICEDAMKIRTETAHDHDPIAALITEAFAKAPHSSGTEAAIVARLRAQGDLLLSLLAEYEGRMVGHVAVSAGAIGGDDNWLCIGPIAVRPSHQGKGFGAALMEEVLARAHDQSAAGVALVGDPDYYHRFGFAPHPGVSVPGIPDQVVLLRPFGRAAPQGVLRFAPGFGIDYDAASAPPLA
jgi:putative acetyltransferase